MNADIHPPAGADAPQHTLRPWLEAAVGVTLVTACFYCYPAILRENVDTLYILVVVIAGVRGGPAPAIGASLISLYCWHYIITPNGGLSPWQAIVSIPVFMVVAVLTGQVAAWGRRGALESQARERETAALYELSLAVVQQTDLPHLLTLLAQRTLQVGRARHCSFWQCRPGEAWTCPGRSDPQDPPPMTSCLEVPDAESFAVQNWVAYPLRVEGRPLGLMLIQPPADSTFPTATERRMLLAVANHAALAMWRDELDRDAAEVRATLQTERLKSSLLSSVSHDLRTPLSSIKACATSLASNEAHLDEPSRQALVASVVKNADRLNTFVGNLLDISRLEAGAWQPMRESFPLMDITASVLGRFNEEQAARIRVLFDDSLPLVNVDGPQMEQILWNLLENALKYSPSHSPVALSAQVLNGVLRVQVRDQGPGVPPGHEEQIFDKFYRAQPESGPPGLGIGLSICKSVVEGHGGRIWVTRGQDGLGAVFQLEMPA